MKTITIRYLVVNAQSSYSILVGRPTLDKLGAVVSTPHLKLKYPLPGGKVGVLCVDQEIARKCYEDSLRARRHLYVTQVDRGVQSIELDPRIIHFDSRPAPAEDVKEVSLAEGRTVKIGVSLTKEDEEGLVAMLKSNVSAFAWSAGGMPGIDPNFLCHHLMVDPKAKPVIQKRRKFGEDKRKAIAGETKKLIAASHIREIQYPTLLANVVMEQKSNGNWRMCTEFTDLNKACPKDSYSLPNIDCLVDSASGYELLSFMDAYSGYNQIRMHPADEDKTAFIADQATYYYRVMPFSLKNARATYQRLMDKVLAEQLGRNAEAYVDDMVVKSDNVSRHFADLQESFDTLARYQLKLNPAKCSFGVQAGKFLGFLLTHRGIEANPNKCSAIINMRSPATVKEVQQLAGRMASLSRFLSREEIHGGMCGSHIGGRSLVYKVTRAGYFWTTLRKDCINWVRKCDECQRHAVQHHSPAERLHSLISPWPFNKWGIDILGPFPMAVRQLKFLIVAVDYFSKWIEAEPVATISAERVRTFLWKNIICRYGIPQVLVSDNGTQFTSERVQSFCKEIGIWMMFTSVEHPQSNGQAESANNVILSGIKKRVENSGLSWVDELPRVLWSYHTTIHSSTQDTPFNLVYGTDAMIPVELKEPSMRATCFTEEESDKGRRVDLDLIAESRDRARINQVAAQRQAAFKYNSKVVPRSFVGGDLVLKRAQLTQLKNKLSPKWVGPYRIEEVVGKGAYRLKTLDGGKIPRTWNAANLSFYYS
uniref:Retrovirus-related Pol polyprotein from transposon opus n=1 Tax=Cajanus cajan TaxID=3821 RepID=A0A151SVQ5_CAJCA|nr:Retrovirus-related Pol polyprotein from transposon opus [Cajanus cajan]